MAATEVLAELRPANGIAASYDAFKDCYDLDIQRLLHCGCANVAMGIRSVIDDADCFGFTHYLKVTHGKKE